MATARASAQVAAKTAPCLFAWNVAMVRGEDPDCAGHVHTCTFGSCRGGADVPDPIRNLTPNILPPWAAPKISYALAATTHFS